MRHIRILTLSAALAWAALASGTTIAAPPPQDARAWIAASNRHAQVLLDVLARVAPESAGQFGVTGLDEEITNLSAEAGERGREATTAALATLQASRKTEQNPLVRQDLDILIRSAQTNLRSGRLSQERLLPYTDVTGLVFGGLRSLLDAQVAPARRAGRCRPAAQVRRARAGLRAHHRAGNAADARAAVERGPPAAGPAPGGTRPGQLPDPGAGPGEAVRRVQDRRLARAICGAEAAARRVPAVRARGRFCPRHERTSGCRRTSMRWRSSRSGVTLQPEPLVAMARQAFVEIQGEMQRLAPAIAKARGLKTIDYRDVIRALKQEQLVGEAILPHYRQRLAEIEAIITREQLVTLPEREARIRIATDAEAAQIAGTQHAAAAPHRQHWRNGRVHSAAEHPGGAGKRDGTLRYDDFTFQAASWTLTAHEARPGPRNAVRQDRRGRRVDGARALRVQQRQRRGLGALRRVDDAALHVARGSAHLAAVPAHARRARVSRSRAAHGTHDARRGPPRAARGCRAVATR